MVLIFKDNSRQYGPYLKIIPDNMVFIFKDNSRQYGFHI